MAASGSDAACREDPASLEALSVVIVGAGHAGGSVAALLRHRHVGSLLITGAGKAFCAGQDLGEHKREPDAPPFDLGESIENFYGPLIRRLWAFPVPILCAVNGVAAGAGVSIALACGVVIAAESARFILAFTKSGLMPDAGATWFLPRLIGQSRAVGLAIIADPRRRGRRWNGA